MSVNLQIQYILSISMRRRYDRLLFPPFYTTLRPSLSFFASALS